MKMPRRASKRSTATKNDGENADAENAYQCKWVTGRRPDQTCDDGYSSSDELFEHVSKSHVTRGTKGYACKWSQCSKRSNVIYITLESLEKHLKTHMQPAVEEDEEDFEENSEGSENEEDIEEEDEENEPPPKRKRAPSKKKVEEDDDDEEEEDEDEDDDFSDEESPVKKGKRKSNGAKSKAKIQKVEADSSAKNSGTKTVDTSGFFYRYTCQWMVKIASAPHPIKCKRKFTKMPEAKEHLLGHHINRLVMNEQPLKCGWEGCDHDEVYSEADGLKEHAPVHAEKPSS